MQRMSGLLRVFGQIACSTTRPTPDHDDRVSDEYSFPLEGCSQEPERRSLRSRIRNSPPVEGNDSALLDCANCGIVRV